MIKDELLKLLSDWSIEQLDHYIEELEERNAETYQLIREVRQIRRKKVARKTLDNGLRTGD